MTTRDRLLTMFARLAMGASFAYYCAALAWVWLSALSGDPAALADMWDLREGTPVPDAWRIWVGVAVSVFTLASLASAYVAVHAFLARISRGDHRPLATAVFTRRLAFGLIGFWAGYNLLTGAVPPLLTAGLAAEFRVDPDWDPLDVDIIFLILGITLYAIARVLTRAHEVEEENRQFV